MIHQNLPNVNFNIKIHVVNITTQNQSKLLPKHPITLPFVPTEEKIHKLESWLLNQFSPSTFDITSQPLPLLSRKPQKTAHCWWRYIICSPLHNICSTPLEGRCKKKKKNLKKTQKWGSFEKYQLGNQLYVVCKWL